MGQLLDKVGKIEKNELVKKAIERGLDGELVLVGLQKLIQTGEYYVPRPVRCQQSSKKYAGISIKDVLSNIHQC
jgi:hypothetical protein